eukprot:4628373-Pleurochrysis_carterae.AAC.1
MAMAEGDARAPEPLALHATALRAGQSNPKAAPPELGRALALHSESIKAYEYDDAVPVAVPCTPLQ